MPRRSVFRSSSLKPLRLALLLLTAALILGCARLSSPPSSSPVPLPSPVQMGSPFQLPLAGTAALPGDRTLTFARVEQDSRCPTDVTCMWPGQAEIVVTVSQPGQPSESLSLIQRPGDEAASTQPIDGMTLKLVELAPYPTTAQSPAANYTATLVLTRP
ncbi:MAG: hypothetical protein OHK0037_08640 [Elainellaceae cyanobacterium]